MTTSIPLAPIKGRRARYTRLDACGNPVIGPATTHVSKGFVTIELAPSYDDGTDIQVSNADGEFEINEPADAQLMFIEATITFTKVDPDLLALITGFPTVVDFQARATGFRLRGGAPVLGGWALEVWSGLAGQFCSTTGDPEFGYTLLPFLRGGKVNSWTIENNAASFSIVSKTRENAQWGKGPYDVVLNPAGVDPVANPPVAGPLLQDVDPRDHLHMERTAVAPPAPADGLAALAA